VQFGASHRPQKTVSASQPENSRRAVVRSADENDTKIKLQCALGLGAEPKMWPFNWKRVLNPKYLPIGDAWRVAEGEHNGKPMIVRMNAVYRAFKGVRGYDHQVGIAMPLLDPEPSGLPSTTENAVLDEIEDSICDLFQESNESLFVAVITTSGMRELVFYTRDPEEVKRKFERAKCHANGHQIQLMIQPDSEWKIYERLI